MWTLLRYGRAAIFTLWDYLTHLAGGLEMNNIDISHSILCAAWLRPWGDLCPLILGSIIQLDCVNHSVALVCSL